MMTVSYRSGFTGTTAENYERYFVLTIATPVSVALLEAADPQPGERVLDVACGTGLVARLAAERVGSGGTVTGLDIAADMIEVARRVSPTAIAWHVGDAESLPFPDGLYNLVLCQMGLMFMPDRRAAVAEMRRVTAAGGRVVVTTPGPIQPVFAIMEEGLVEHISGDLGGFVRAVFSLHDSEDVASLLRESGLVDVTAAASTATFDLGAPAEFLWQYINLTPMGPFVAQARPRRRRRWSATWSRRGSRCSSTACCRSTSRWWSPPAVGERAVVVPLEAAQTIRVTLPRARPVLTCSMATGASASAKEVASRELSPPPYRPEHGRTVTARIASPQSSGDRKG